MCRSIFLSIFLFCSPLIGGCPEIAEGYWEGHCSDNTERWFEIQYKDDCEFIGLGYGYYRFDGVTTIQRQWFDSNETRTNYVHWDSSEKSLRGLINNLQTSPNSFFVYDGTYELKNIRNSSISALISDQMKEYKYGKLNRQSSGDTECILHLVADKETMGVKENRSFLIPFLVSNDPNVPSSWRR